MEVRHRAAGHNLARAAHQADRRQGVVGVQAEPDCDPRGRARQEQLVSAVARERPHGVPNEQASEREARLLDGRVEGGDVELRLPTEGQDDLSFIEEHVNGCDPWDRQELLFDSVGAEGAGETIHTKDEVGRTGRSRDGEGKEKDGSHPANSLPN